jgi:hypothetical protein
MKRHDPKVRDNNDRHFRALLSSTRISISSSRVAGWSRKENFRQSLYSSSFLRIEKMTPTAYSVEAVSLNDSFGELHRHSI